jgi:nucleotide sugar dehydrogenase
MTIGFIGQGYIGKNYADDFERRGFTVVRYALEEPYRNNKEKIKDCDIVFIAVPTPTTPEGFDSSIIEKALQLVGSGKIAVIKSTVLPGTTSSLQQTYPGITVLVSPEFLSEATAAQDAAHPSQNIIGMSVKDTQHEQAADTVHKVLPRAPHTLTTTSEEAELFKYAHNLNGYFQVMLSNVLYDAADALGASWRKIQEAIEGDPLISNRYAKPMHKTGRGAGGHCFIKDFAAFEKFYASLVPADTAGIAMLKSLEQKNIELLTNSNKDLDLLEGVYGKKIFNK